MGEIVDTDAGLVIEGAYVQGPAQRPVQGPAQGPPCDLAETDAERLAPVNARGAERSDEEDFELCGCGEWILERTARFDLRVTDEGDERLTALADFLRDNEEDAATCAAARALRPGESVTLGLGVRVERLW